MAQINYQLAQGLETNIDSKLIARMLGLGIDTKRLSVTDNNGNTYRFPSEERIADTSVNFAYNIGYDGAVSAPTVGEALDSLSSAIGLSPSGGGISFVDLGTHNFVAGQHNAFKIGSADIPEGSASILEIVISDDSSIIQAIGHVMLGSNTAGASQSWLLDWSYNNIAYKYAIGDWELYTDTASPSSFGFGIKTGINFNAHNVKIATIGAQIIGIDAIDLNVSTNLPTFIELFDITKNTGGGSGLPSDFIICRNSTDVINALALAQPTKTIFLYDGVSIVLSAPTGLIDVYGYNLILGSITSFSFATPSPANALDFNNSGGASIIRTKGIQTGFVTASAPLDFIDLNGVTIYCDLISVPSEYTINGLGSIYWRESSSSVLPVAGTANAEQHFGFDWGLTNVFSADTKADLIKYLQYKIPRKTIFCNAEEYFFNDNEVVTGIYGINQITGSNVVFSIPTPVTGNLTFTGLAGSNAQINFTQTQFGLFGISGALILDTVRIRCRNFLTILPTNVNFTTPNTGDFIYEKEVISATYTGVITKNFWDNTAGAGISVGGLSGEILTSDGAGGITPLGAPTKFGYDSVLGYVDSPTTPLGATGFIVSNGFFYFNCASNSLSEFQFRDNSGSSFGKLTGNSTLGTLLFSSFNEIIISSPFKLTSSTTLTPAQVPDQGTDVNKVMLVMDSTSGDLERRPIPSGGGTPSPQPVVSVYSNNDTDTFTASSPLVVPWNLEKYKDAGFAHSNTTNNTRIEVLNDGTYQIGGRLEIFSDPDQRTQPEVKLLKNGVLIDKNLASGYIRNAGFSSDYWALEFTFEPEKLLANDYFEVQLSLSSTNPASFSATLIGSDSAFWMVNLQGEKGDTGAQGPSGTDTNAVHVNVANEIAQITAKTAPLDPDDVLILEDSEDSYNKKKITVGDLPATSKKSEVVSYVKAGISNGANVAFTTRSAFTNPHFFTTNSGINWNIKKVSLNSAFGLFNVASFEIVLEYVAVDTAWAIGSGTNLHSETFTSLTKNVSNNVISGSAITVAVPNNVNIFAYFKLNSGIYSITDAEIIVQLEEQ